MSYFQFYLVLIRVKFLYKFSDTNGLEISIFCLSADSTSSTGQMKGQAALDFKGHPSNNDSSSGNFTFHANTPNNKSIPQVVVDNNHRMPDASPSVLSMDNTNSAITTTRSVSLDGKLLSTLPPREDIISTASPYLFDIKDQLIEPKESSGTVPATSKLGVHFGGSDILRKANLNSRSTQRPVSLFDLVDLSNDLKSGASILAILHSQFDFHPPPQAPPSTRDMERDFVYGLGLTGNLKRQTLPESFLSPLELRGGRFGSKTAITRGVPFQSDSAPREPFSPFIRENEYPLSTVKAGVNLPSHQARQLFVDIPIQSPAETDSESKVAIQNQSDTSHNLEPSEFASEREGRNEGTRRRNVGLSDRHETFNITNGRRNVSLSDINIPFNITNGRRNVSLSDINIPFNITNGRRNVSLSDINIPFNITNGRRNVSLSDINIPFNITNGRRNVSLSDINIPFNITNGRRNVSLSDINIPFNITNGRRNVSLSDINIPFNITNGRRNVSLSDINIPFDITNASRLGDGENNRRAHAMPVTVTYRESLNKDITNTDIGGDLKGSPEGIAQDRVKILNRLKKQEHQSASQKRLDLSRRNPSVVDDRVITNERRRRLELENGTMVSGGNELGLYDPVLDALIDELAEQDIILKGNEIVHKHGELPLLTQLLQTIMSLPSESGRAEMTSSFPRLSSEIRNLESQDTLQQNTNTSTQESYELQNRSDIGNAPVSVQLDPQVVLGKTQMPGDRGDAKGTRFSVTGIPVESNHSVFRSHPRVSTGSPEIDPGSPVNHAASISRALKRAGTERPDPSDDLVLDYILRRWRVNLTTHEANLMTISPGQGNTTRAGSHSSRPEAARNHTAADSTFLRGGGISRALNNGREISREKTPGDVISRDPPNTTPETTEEDLLGAVINKPHILIPLRPPMTDFLYELSLAETHPQSSAPSLSSSTSPHASSFLVSSPSLSPPSFPASSTPNREASPASDSTIPAPRKRLRCRFQCFYYRENPETGDWFEELRRIFQGSSRSLRPTIPSKITGRANGRSMDAISAAPNTGIGAQQLQRLRSRLTGRRPTAATPFRTIQSGDTNGALAAQSGLKTLTVGGRDSV